MILQLDPQNLNFSSLMMFRRTSCSCCKGFLEVGLRRDQEKLLNEAAHVTALRVNSEENSGVGLLLCRGLSVKQEKIMAYQKKI